MSSILLKNGRIIDVRSRTIVHGRDILINGDRISLSFMGGADEEIDLNGAFVSPGLIDGHIHIESSMLCPLEFAKEAVRHGTTSVFVDPHEIANVLGADGIRLFLEQVDLVPFTMNVGIPSCVPATGMETSGGIITLGDIEEFLKDSRVYGLAEMMNFPGIIQGIGDAREKVKLALEAGKIVDGHCPGLRGEDLGRYISNGEPDWEVRIGSDHESTTAEEAIEKWEKGMFVMLRHGSASKDLENILPEVCRRGVDLKRFGLVSDDLSAIDLKRRGHVNHLVAIAAKVIEKEKGFSADKAAIEAIAMATVNTARYFRKNTGVIADGAKADLMVFESLENISPSIVFSRGKIVVKDSGYSGPENTFDYEKYSHPVKIGGDYVKDLVVHSEKQKETVRVIGVKPNTLLTEEVKLDMYSQEGVIKSDKGRGVSKIAVLERHRGTGNVSSGFIKGFDYSSGAIASTVAHDSHNLVVLGSDETSMIRAIENVKRNGGGLVAVFGEKIESLPLALGGLMSTENIESVLAQHDKLEELIKEMGFSFDPYPTLSFVALPVIPKLKITDKGLVDVKKFDFVSLFA